MCSWYWLIFFFKKPRLGLCLGIMVDHMVGIKWLEEKEYYQCKENSSSRLAFPPHTWIRHFLCKGNAHWSGSMKKGCWYVWKGYNQLLKTLEISFYLGMHHCTYERQVLRITESFRLKKTFRIIESSCKPMFALKQKALYQTSYCWGLVWWGRKGEKEK